MSQIYDDRRDEPRFPAQGTARIHHEEAEFDGQVLDLSLNGVMIRFDAAPGLDRGLRVALQLGLDGVEEFSGEATIMYSAPDRLGLEFFDMAPSDFDVLARLIEALRKTWPRSG